MKLVYLFLNKWYIFAGLFITVWSINFTLSSLPQNSSPEKSSVFSLQRHWDFLKEIKKAETAYTNANISPDSLTNKSGPFRIHSTSKKRPSKNRSQKKHNLPVKRNISLKGITNGNSAILVGRNGRSIVVEVGDTVDESLITQINSSSVSLKDRSGTFVLKLE